MSRLEITAVCCVAPDVRRRQIAASPDLPPPSGSGRLAVVGGGPSVAAWVNDLRAWDGDIWAINGAWRWCKGLGIDATLYAMDPAPCLVDIARGARRAVLASHVHPDVWGVIEGDARKIPDTDAPGPTSAVAAAYLAIVYGWTGVTFFGCESSYGLTTHAYGLDEPCDKVWIRAGGRSFVTKCELLLQAERLAEIIRTCPQFYAERSGGLLAALVADPDYDVTHVSRSMMPEAA